MAEREAKIRANGQADAADHEHAVGEGMKAALAAGRDYFIDVPRHQDDVALITTKQEGAALARSLADSFAVIMGNHGVTFCGTSIPHAICVERAYRAGQPLPGQSPGARNK